MAQKTKFPSVKRFGSRYGRRVREKLGMIEALQKKVIKCPYCRKPKVKRLSAGIFTCNACKAKFTGKAYSIGKISQPDKALDMGSIYFQANDETLDENDAEEVSMSDEEAQKSETKGARKAAKSSKKPKAASITEVEQPFFYEEPADEQAGGPEEGDMLEEEKEKTEQDENDEKEPVPGKGVKNG